MEETKAKMAKRPTTSANPKHLELSNSKKPPPVGVKESRESFFERLSQPKRPITANPRNVEKPKSTIKNSATKPLRMKFSADDLKELMKSKESEFANALDAKDFELKRLMKEFEDFKRNSKEEHQLIHEKVENLNAKNSELIEKLQSMELKLKDRETNCKLDILQKQTEFDKKYRELEQKYQKKTVLLDLEARKIEHLNDQFEKLTKFNNKDLEEKSQDVSKEHHNLSDIVNDLEINFKDKIENTDKHIRGVSPDLLRFENSIKEKYNQHEQGSIIPNNLGESPNKAKLSHNSLYSSSISPSLLFQKTEKL